MSFFIAEVEIYINQGRRCSDHVGEKENYPKEIRYCICWGSGIIMTPSCLYETPIMSHCSGFQQHMARCRKFKEALDNTYFKYCDDAEPVLENINRFIEWLKNQTNKKIVKGYWMDLLRHNPDTEDSARMRALKIGSPKRRSELTGLMKEMAEEDFLESRFGNLS